MRQVRESIRETRRDTEGGEEKKDKEVVGEGEIGGRESN